MQKKQYYSFSQLSKSFKTIPRMYIYGLRLWNSWIIWSQTQSTSLRNHFFQMQISKQNLTFANCGFAVCGSVCGSAHHCCTMKEESQFSPTVWDWLSNWFGFILYVGKILFKFFIFLLHTVTVIITKIFLFIIKANKSSFHHTKLQLLLWNHS